MGGQGGPGGGGGGVRVVQLATRSQLKRCRNGHRYEKLDEHYTARTNVHGSDR